MQYKKFILSFADEGSQEEEMNRFLRGHKIVKIDENFMPEEHMWVFLVKYLGGEQNGTSSPQKRSDSKYIPEKDLDAKQLEKYKRFAEIRLELSKKYDIKAYVIFSNRELGELSKMENVNEQSLLNIDGYGKARLEQFGHEFLIMLHQNETSGNVDDENPPF